MNEGRSGWGEAESEKGTDGERFGEGRERQTRLQKRKGSRDGFPSASEIGKGKKLPSPCSLSVSDVPGRQNPAWVS